MSPPPDLATASDQDVVALARQEREEGYREILRRFERPVYALIHRAVGNHEEARDLTQETFIKAFHTLDSYRPDRRFTPWILGVANHVVVDYLRHKELTPLPLYDAPDVTPPSGQIQPIALHTASDELTPEPRARARKLAPAIDEAIERLRPQYRECFRLRVIEERSYEDIAEILDLPVGTVASYLHRARKELQELLDPQIDASL